MFARRFRALPGAIVSLMLISAPAYADVAQDTKHRIAQFRHRITQAARAMRWHAMHAIGSPIDDADAAAADGNGEASYAGDDSYAGKDNYAAWREEILPLSRQVFESGIASWYGPWFNGRITSSGRRFNQNDMTAAHPWLPMGTHIRVRLVGTNRAVDVTVTDRPGNKHRIIDLSREAARRLGMARRGTALVALSEL